MKKVFGFFLFLLLCSSSFAQQIGNPVSIKGIDATVVISSTGTIGGDLRGGKVTLKVLTFQETTAQKIKSIQETLSINRRTINAGQELDSSGNKYAVFEISDTGEFSYNITARIETNSGLSSLQEFDLKENISSFKEFSEPTKNVESNDARVRTLALNKFPSTSWLETLRGVSEWTNNYVTYDWQYYPETYSTLQVIESKRGVCDEFATLSTGMLRAKGIPARFVVGVVYSGEQWGYHAWGEAFNPKSGWVPIDATYAETGLVDGTHIVMGYFADPEKALDFFVAPVTSSVNVKPKEVNVQLHSKQLFSNIVFVSATDLEIKTGEWFQVRVEAENQLASYSIIPLQIVMPKEITLNEASTKSVLFAPRERKKIEWQVRVDAGLQPNQFLDGEYKVISLQEEITKRLKVTPGSLQQGKAKIEAIDILPKIVGKNLSIEIVLKNSGQATGTAKAGISGTGIESTKTIEGLSRAKIMLVVENYENKPYEVYITGDGINALTKVQPREDIEKSVPERTEEKPEKQQQEQLSALPSGPLFAEQNLLLFFSGIAVLVILLLLKELLGK